VDTIPLVGEENLAARVRRWRTSTGPRPAARRFDHGGDITRAVQELQASASGRLAEHVGSCRM